MDPKDPSHSATILNQPRFRYAIALHKLCLNVTDIWLIDEISSDETSTTVTQGVLLLDNAWFDDYTENKNRVPMVFAVGN